MARADGQPGGAGGRKCRGRRAGRQAGSRTRSGASGRGQPAPGSSAPGIPVVPARRFVTNVLWTGKKPRHASQAKTSHGKFKGQRLFQE
ncbi:unnamed protein product [Calypogeia fissa]